MGVTTYDQLVVAIAAIVTAIGATAKVRLFTNTPTLGPDTTPADFVEPVGTWYTPADAGFPKPVYGDPYTPAAGEVAVQAASVQHNFVVGVGNDPVDIKGWWVTDAAGTTYYHGGYLPATVHMATDLDAVVSSPVLAIQSAA